MTIDNTQAQVGDDDLYQDVMSQFPFLNGYTHFMLGFQLDSDESHNAIVDALKTGVQRVIDKVPWLGGQVACESSPEGTATFRPTAWPEGLPVNEIVRLNICDAKLPPMAELLRTGTPVSVLPASVLTPWPGLPQPHGISGPVPIIAMQANFISGGLILTISCHHNIMDATAIFQFIRLLTVVMKNGEIMPPELDQANRDRRGVIPLIPRGEPVKNFSHLRRAPDYVQRTPSSTSRWCYFRFPVAAMPRMRKLASRPQTTMSEQGSPAPLLSDNDILSAFCWNRISAVRLGRGAMTGGQKVGPTSTTKFNRAIDGRVALGVPPSYMGHMVCHASTRLTLQQVVTQPLSTTAAALRRDLNAANTPWSIRSYATFLAREPDRSKLLYGGSFDPNTDIGASSLVTDLTGASKDDTASGFAFMSLGDLLGKPRFIRRPDLPLIPGVLYFQPVENGAIPILLCLSAEDLDGLMKDRQWTQYMKYVG
ncbi:Trichothecene 3-O-acetyltransferase [Cytospora mali]|uniref:Trichothecene 3-O-acetyltransferase n=1 Tax=Cytospora mali TaxID=578113 RepID=A0A194VYW6_CYTMA|nr:Trichothecene 3-O-acetyltransferase [Valsa mali]